jgi:16S rRNA (guanine527-N7)-methyltransferase
MTGSTTETFRKALEASLLEFGLERPAETALSALTAHYSLMIEWNQRTNLTRITEPVQAARFHYAESLCGSRFINNGESVLDIGSGAGFPGLPLAICRSDISVTALESNQKKARFLEEAKNRIQIANFTVIQKRLEEFDWTSFDALICRALDRAEKQLPKVIKRLSEGQRIVIYCGADLAEKISKLHPRFQTHRIPQSTNRLIAIVG